MWMLSPSLGADNAAAQYGHAFGHVFRGQYPVGVSRTAQPFELVISVDWPALRQT